MNYFNSIHSRRFRRKERFSFKKVAILIIIILFVGLLWYQQAIHRPIDKNDKSNIQFIIERGENSSTIISKLAKQNIIRSKLALMIYSKINNDFSRNIRAGNYNLNRFLSSIEIIDILTSSTGNQEVTIVIPEGYDIEQTSTYLESLGVLFSSKDFQNEAHMQDKYANYSFLNKLKNGDSLEGYLFPDTYQIFYNATPEEIITKMLNNFGYRVDQNLLDEISKQGRTLEDVIILASIVQKESPTNDMYKIAGVFWNRLEGGYRLESDATVNYVLGTNNLQPSFEATEVQHPYNTYENAGLPPGPISNPGLDAIKAAIYPENHPYYFFLSKANKETVFSKTFEEHLSNKAKYLD